MQAQHPQKTGDHATPEISGADAQSLYAKGVSDWTAGRQEDAIAAIDAALRLRPDFPEALAMGGYILGGMHKAEGAIAFYRRALELAPGAGLLWTNLGKQLFKLRRFGEALAAFDEALALSPDGADCWNNRAGALRELGRLEDSGLAARKALGFRPDFAEAAINLGNANLKLDRMEDALQAYLHALMCGPRLASAHCGAALALKGLGRFEEARAAFEEAERLGSPEAASGRGCLQLLCGDFEAGWEGYEARWADGRSLRDVLGVRFREWRGLDDSARRLLVLNDHGLGDTIQFCRYLPLIRSRGVAVSLVCPQRLHRLFAPLGVELLAEAPSDEIFDAQIAISSLPRAFKTRLDRNLPNARYLSAEPALCSAWGARIGDAGFKIGVIWQGNPNPEADMARSFPLRALAPLSAIANVRLISLQKGFGTEQLAALPPGMVVESFGESFDEGPDAFADTAAAMMKLDLIITCDTSTAHLAGALGRPVWVALKKDAEWRRLLEREDSPWYPSMRLFRQRERGDWDGVFSRMGEVVSDLARDPNPARVVAIPSGVGDLIDRIIILEIKARRLSNPAQLRNVNSELRLLKDLAETHLPSEAELRALKAELGTVNARLWDVENDIRACEAAGDFGERFVELARAVYKTNDRRAALKRCMNLLCKSEIIEEKYYVGASQSGIA
jgi:tetratricopeptide (TPR) repeat protein